MNEELYGTDIGTRGQFDEKEKYNYECMYV